MENNSFTPADIAALQNNGMGNQGSWIWFLLIFVLLGWGGGRGAAPMAGNAATQSQLTAGLNNQAIQNQLQQLALATQQNNYETAQLINGQTTAMIEQNNVNLINAIQGFNNISTQISSQTNQLGSKLDNLGFAMEQCCCGVKTQLLNDRLEDRNRELAVAQSALNNANQTQTILGNLGRFVAWSGTGAQTTGIIAK